MRGQNQPLKQFLPLLNAQSDRLMLRARRRARWHGRCTSVRIWAWPTNCDLNCARNELQAIRFKKPHWYALVPLAGAKTGYPPLGKGPSLLGAEAGQIFDADLCGTLPCRQPQR